MNLGGQSVRLLAKPGKDRGEMEFRLTVWLEASLVRW